jgi:cytochrome c oxidase subunit II
MCRERGSKAQWPCKKHAIVIAAAMIAGCAGEQSALDPAGREAQELARLTWILVAGATAILALVVLAAGYAVFRNPERRIRVSSRALIVGGGIVFPVVVLSALLVYGVGLMDELRGPGNDGLHLHVTGHMWWWEVRYRGPDGEWIATANEIGIPVGRPVTVSLSSEDVIHSFWVPSLAGKMDMIPGRRTEIRLHAERPGTYRGQCAEFCGDQHALMVFRVVALPPADFERWLEALRAPARMPADAQARAGSEAFLAQGCGNCHTVRGLVQGRLPGPDLTHLARRPWLGAGALPNTPENLVTWIAHGEAVKPGRAMPSYAYIEQATLSAIAHFLAGLE